MIEEIEIRPGIFIEVSSRVKSLAGFKEESKINSTLAATAMYRAHESLRERSGYPLLIIDEAVEITRESGPHEANRITGVPIRIIVSRMHEKGEEIPFYRRSRLRYPLEVMRECVMVAKSILSRNETIVRQYVYRGKTINRIMRKWTHARAFIQAGHRLGISGKYVERIWLRSGFSLTSSIPEQKRPDASAKQENPQGLPVRPPTYAESMMIGQECVRLQGLSGDGHPLIDMSGRENKTHRRRRRKDALLQPPTQQSPVPLGDSATSGRATGLRRRRKRRERRLLLWSTTDNGRRKMSRFLRRGCLSAGCSWRENLKP